jgi:O-antigen/teichoic acid export membrane protein
MSEEPISGIELNRAKSVIGRNAAWAVAQVIVSTMVLFVVYFFAVRAAGVDQIGLLSILSATVAVARLSELGLSGAVTRFLPEHLVRGERTDAAQVVVTATAALIFIVGVVTILVWPALNALLPLIIDGGLIPEARSIVPIALFSLWMNIVSGCVAMSLDGVNRADRRAQITLLSQGVFAIIVVLTIRRLGIVAIPVAQAVQAVCVFFFATIALLQELPETKAVRPSFACFRRIWLYGAHLQLITLLILFYDPATRLLLNYFGSLGAVGYFDLANRLIGQVRSVIVSANQVMVPHYANLNIAKPEMVARTVRANFQILLVISTVSFSMLSVSTFLIGKLWVGQSDPGFIEVCLILMIGYFVNTLSVGIYFMNIGVGAVLNNVVIWVVIILVNVVGGTFGGMLFGTTGVVVSVSAALVCGSFVAFADYLRKSNIRVRTLVSITALRFSVVGGIVFFVAILTAAIGLTDGNRIAASFTPIVLGGSVWICFVLHQSLVAGQSPLLWARTTIASLRT